MAKSHKRAPVCEAFEIGVEATRIFESKFPAKSWLLRAQNPDFHIDFKIEAVENGHPTAKEIAAQVKGTKKDLGKRLRRKIETRHLNYYLKQRIPVFIFLVDVEGKKVFWLFAQKHLREEIRPSKLSRPGTINLNFARTNDLDDLSFFRSEVEASIRYMNELYPGSILAAARARKEYLESLDPRFSVSVGFKNGHEQIEAQSEIPLTLKARFIADLKIANDAIYGFNEYGITFDIPVAGLKIEGSPLIEQFFSPLEKSVLSVRSDPFSGTLQFEIDFDTEDSKIIQLDGFWSTGRSGATLDCGLAGTPLKIRSTLKFEGSEGLKNSRMLLQFDWKAWDNQTITNLSGFEEFSKLMEAFEHGNSIRICWVFLGKPIYGGLGQPSGELGNLAAIQWLRGNREIAKRLKIFPRFLGERDLDPNTRDEYLFLETLLRAKRLVSNLEQTTYSILVENPNRSITPDQNLPPSDLRFEGTMPIRFFDFTIHLNVKISFSLANLNAAKADQSGLLLTFAFSAGCEQTIEIVENANGEPLFQAIGRSYNKA